MGFLSADPGSAAKTRLIGVDAGRYLALAAVVFIHTLQRQTLEFGADLGGVIDQICRFAVPFFFIASGFFLAKKELYSVSRLILSLAGRIAPVFIIWVALYLAFTDSLGKLAQLDFLARTIVTGGPGYHLWFLPALGFALTAVAVMKEFTGWMLMFCITALLYLVGLAIGSYEIQGIKFEAAARILCGPMFVLVGFWVSKSGWRPTLKEALALFLAGGAVHFFEAYWLDAHHINQFHKNDFLLGTLPLGLGAFLITLNLPSQASLVRVLAALGTYSFGMYAMHLFFVIGLRDVLEPQSFGERLLLAIAVLVCSTVITFALSRIRALGILLT